MDIDRNHVLKLIKLRLEESNYKSGIKLENFLYLLNKQEKDSFLKIIEKLREEGFIILKRNYIFIGPAFFNEIETKANKVKSKDVISFIFGTFFIILIIAISVFYPYPTSFQIFVFRLVLSLAAAGIGAVIPGVINLEMKENKIFFIRAGGAIALFVLTYLLNPPVLLSSG